MNGHINSCNMYVSSCVNKILVETTFATKKNLL